MPGSVARVADERKGLLAYLAHERYVLRISAYGLTDDQARLAPISSTLTVGGLIKHVATTQRSRLRRLCAPENTWPAPETASTLDRSEVDTATELAC
jgi:Protein of unknown function (DUF664)